MLLRRRKVVDVDDCEHVNRASQDVRRIGVWLEYTRHGPFSTRTTVPVLREEMSRLTGKTQWTKQRELRDHYLR
jgi:hypothetical protein